MSYMVYITHASGYRAFGTEVPLTQVSEERYERILKRFVKGDLFDGMQISNQASLRDGIGLCRKGSKVEMTFSCLRIREAARLAAFRAGMAEVGFEPPKEHTWNVGLGDHLESTTLTYETRKTQGAVRDLSKHALDLIFGESKDGIFVKVWSSKDGRSRPGITIVRTQNLLDQVP